MGKSSKSSKRKEKVDPLAWVNDIVSEFFKPVVAESEPSATGTVEESAPTSSEETFNRCEQGACKRKMTHGCLHKMCHICCIAVASEEECFVHLNAKRRQFDNERVFEEMMQEMGGARDFSHAEDKLTKVCQTAVVWCLKDFLRYRRFSEEVFEKYERERRKKLLDLRRHGGHALLTSLAGASPSIVTAVRGSGGRKSAGVGSSPVISSSSSASAFAAAAVSPGRSSRSPAPGARARMRVGKKKVTSARDRRFHKWLEENAKPAGSSSAAARFAEFLRTCSA